MRRKQDEELKNLCWEIRASMDSLYDNLCVVEVAGHGWKQCALNARNCSLALRNYFKEFRHLSTKVSEDTIIPKKDGLKNLKKRLKERNIK